jgi:CheY-like chemotaxis protein
MLPFAIDPGQTGCVSRLFSAAGRVPTVLVVEDDPFVRELAVEMLEDEGCRVLAAATAEQALGLMFDTRPDVLFTDIDLGRGLNGLALARAARAVMPDLPVIYASGGRAALGRSEGVAGSAFVPKPYRSDQVCTLIGRLLQAEPSGR